jgi:hypothetical protein
VTNLAEKDFNAVHVFGISTATDIADKLTTMSAELLRAWEAQK